MKNWRIRFKKLYISWYNIKNEPMDEYPQSSNIVYQKDPIHYWKKIFHIFIGEYGIEWCNEWYRTHLIFEGPDKMLWIRFRGSNYYYERGKWRFKIWIQDNDHISCG